MNNKWTPVFLTRLPEPLPLTKLINIPKNRLRSIRSYNLCITTVEKSSIENTIWRICGQLSFQMVCVQTTTSQIYIKSRRTAKQLQLQCYERRVNLIHGDRFFGLFHFFQYTVQILSDYFMQSQHFFKIGRRWILNVWGFVKQRINKFQCTNV